MATGVKINVVYRNAKYNKKVERELHRRLGALAVDYCNRVKQSFPDSGSSSSSAGATKGERRSATQGKSGPPHVQTGHLKANVWWEPAGKLNVKMGTGLGGKSSVGYAAYLELGFNAHGTYVKRPFLLPMIRATQSRYKKFLTRPIK